ncbi:ABC transporter permease [Desulfosporosinus sp. BICA1-9]|uniref:ABC transporter permease n=1 Tax=Desulfosporosinus sp. BICA1-9 TaxID=1531958 RepID=UPI000A440F42|nr:ABC transporter permease [Desulfosporosinus sp. BICA1-9]HBW34342.1 ABC transporter permease [Desulfosporosinus sp.]
MLSASVKNKVTIYSWRILITTVLLSIWELGVRYKAFDAFYISQPSEIFNDLITLFATGEVFPHIAITMEEALLGLVIGTIAGVTVGFVLGKFEPVAKVLDPIIMALYGIPKLTLGPLFILWFGMGIKSKVFIALISVFFLTFFSAYSGFKNVSPNLINTVKLMGATQGQILRKIIIPSCVPWLLNGLRTSLGAALLGAIVGEYIAANSGLGWMVSNASGMYNTTRVLSTIVILSALMAILNYCVTLLDNRLLKWRVSTE